MQSYYSDRETHKKLIFFKKACQTQEISVFENSVIKKTFVFERLELSTYLLKAYQNLDSKYSSNFQHAHMRKFIRTQVLIEKNTSEKRVDFRVTTFCVVLYDFIFGCVYLNKISIPKKRFLKKNHFVELEREKMFFFARTPTLFNVPLLC